MFDLTGLEYGIIGFVVLMVLLALRIPIGVAMLLVGLGGYIEIAGKTALLSYLKIETKNDQTSVMQQAKPFVI